MPRCQQLGPGAEAARAQRQHVESLGGTGIVFEGKLDPASLETRTDFSGVIWWSDAELGREFAIALARRTGPIIPLITDYPDVAHVYFERHVCINTTASGGNAELLALVS